MRAVFLALLAANLLFFAWSRYYSADETAADGVVLKRSDPEKLKIVPATSAAASACLEWGSFTAAEYPRAEKALEPLALGPRLGQRRTEETAGWWVFIPSQGSRPGAFRQAAELKALGINDFFVMGEETDTPWALSLGVFRSERAAAARLASLRELGVRNALIGKRDTVVPRIWLQVKGVDPALEARLKDVARQAEGSELRPCP
jgi:sporulation related protein